MARGNCCDICTPPPDSCVLGACCYDDGDNVDITCEDNVTESYCLTKPNSIFNARGVCGEKITCDSYYEPKISQLGPYSFIVIKSDGSVVTWKTIETGNSIDPEEESFMLSSEDALRIQPTPFGDNGAVRIYSDGHQFCAVRKKDGTFVVWGKYIDSSQATVIEEGLKNAKKILYSINSGCALREDGTLFTFYVGPVFQSTLNTGYRIPQNLSALLSDPDNPVVDIFANSTQAGANTVLHATAFCALLKNGNAFIWGFDNFGTHAYDVNNDGVVSSSDQLSLLNFISRGDPYNSKYDVNNDGRVSTLDLNAVTTYLSTHGAGSDNETEGVQIPITNVSGVFGGARSFSFIKNDGSFYTTLNPGSKQSQLTNVSGVFFTDRAACALQYDGTVVAWGNSGYGGFIDPVIEAKINHPSFDNQQNPITSVFSTERAFCVTRANNSNFTNLPNLITWGGRFHGGDNSLVYTSNPFTDPTPTNDSYFRGSFDSALTQTSAGRNTFLSDITHWGGVNYKGKDPFGDGRFLDSTALFTKEVIRIASNKKAICMLAKKAVGFPTKIFYEVISFGDISHGAYGTTNRYDLTKNTPLRRIEVDFDTELVSNENSFAFISKEGGIVCWGNASYVEGSDSRGVNGNRSSNGYVEQDFIDEQVKKIGANVNLHGDLITAGFEGCTSSSTQKDFCKTEDNLRVDCNPHTGKCDYGLGDFYPFIKVDNCKQCEEISANKNHGSTFATNIHQFTRDGVLVPNFSPTFVNSEVTCFSKGQLGGVVQNFQTFGSNFYTSTYQNCLSQKDVSISGDSAYYSRFPTPILGEDVGAGPSGSCCFGLICEEGYNEYKHHPLSEQCKDFKICYEVLTEKQCYDQKFTLKAGIDGELPFIKTRGVNDSAEITYKTYHDFVPDVNCVDRTGEEGCQP